MLIENSAEGSKLHCQDDYIGLYSFLRWKQVNISDVSCQGKDTLKFIRKTGTEPYYQPRSGSIV